MRKYFIPLCTTAVKRAKNSQRISYRSYFVYCKNKTATKKNCKRIKECLKRLTDPAIAKENKVQNVFSFP